MGLKSLHGANVKATDLRASMSLIIAALAAEGETNLFELEHLKRGYEDRTDYSEASGIHFTFPFAPWFRYNTKFYREWSRCNDEI